MRSTYYPQTYQCPSCNLVQKHYVWSNELEKAKHECKGEECQQQLTIEHLYEEPEVQAPGIKTMTKNRIVMDRRKRSHKHFMNEVLPTFPKNSPERKYHLQKNGYKS